MYSENPDKVPLPISEDKPTPFLAFVFAFAFVMCLVGLYITDSSPANMPATSIETKTTNYGGGLSMSTATVKTPFGSRTCRTTYSEVLQSATTKCD